MFWSAINVNERFILADSWLRRAFALRNLVVFGSPAQI
jgi:hypothetical protein